MNVSIYRQQEDSIKYDVTLELFRIVSALPDKFQKLTPIYLDNKEAVVNCVSVINDAVVFGIYDFGTCKNSIKDSKEFSINELIKVLEAL